MNISCFTEIPILGLIKLAPIFFRLRNLHDVQTVVVLINYFIVIVIDTRSPPIDITSYLYDDKAFNIEIPFTIDSFKKICKRLCFYTHCVLFLVEIVKLGGFYLCKFSMRTFNLEETDIERLQRAKDAASPTTLEHFRWVWHKAV